MQERTYRVTGMTCASCAAHAQKAAAKVAGVEHADVNIATEKLTVRFDEKTVGFEQLKKAVEDS
jgi:Cu+-exporting ATPase